MNEVQCEFCGTKYNVRLEWHNPSACAQVQVAKLREELLKATPEKLEAVISARNKHFENELQAEQKYTETVARVEAADKQHAADMKYISDVRNELSEKQTHWDSEHAKYLKVTKELDEARKALDIEKARIEALNDIHTGTVAAFASARKKIEQIRSELIPESENETTLEAASRVRQRVRDLSREKDAVLSAPIPTVPTEIEGECPPFSEMNTEQIAHFIDCMPSLRQYSKWASTLCVELIDRLHEANKTLAAARKRLGAYETAATSYRNWRNPPSRSGDSARFAEMEAAFAALPTPAQGQCDPDAPIRCATFGGVEIPPDVRARMDADRVAAQGQGETCGTCMHELDGTRNGHSDVCRECTEYSHHKPLAAPAACTCGGSDAGHLRGCALNPDVSDAAPTATCETCANGPVVACSVSSTCLLGMDHRHWQAKPSPAAEPAKTITIVFIVNGEDVLVESAVLSPLQDARENALKQTNNTGRPPAEWEVRTEVGVALNVSERVDDLGLADGVRLFLTPRVGCGGSPLSPATDKFLPADVARVADELQSALEFWTDDCPCQCEACHCLATALNDAVGALRRSLRMTPQRSVRGEMGEAIEGDEDTLGEATIYFSDGDLPPPRTKVTVSWGHPATSRCRRSGTRR